MVEFDESETGPGEALEALEEILEFKDPVELIEAAMHLRRLFQEPLYLTNEDILRRHQVRLRMMIS